MPTPPARRAAVALAIGLALQPLPSQAATAALDGRPSGESSGSPAGLPQLRQVINRIEEELQLPVGNATLGGTDLAKADGNLVGLIAAAGLVFLVLFPALKLLFAGATALFLLNGLGKEEEDEDSDIVVRRLVAQLAGDLPDKIDERTLRVTRLNDQLVSMRSAVVEKTVSRTAAEVVRDGSRRERFLASWHTGIEALDLDEEDAEKVDDALQKFSDEELERESQFKDARKFWVRAALRKKWLASFYYQVRLRVLLAKKFDLESELVASLREALPRKSLTRLRDLLGGRRTQLSWLAHATESAATDDKARVYVLAFDGDVSASRASQLAREVSAILCLPNRPQQVVLRLRSPGGTVTGYGLAAAQLMRLREHGIRLVVCVDQLAASGGYMMACCGDEILCSPFAAVGSIGVVQTLPNVAKRLDREGLSFVQTTAGKWKSTLSPFLEPSSADLAKTKEDLAMIYTQFADWVKQNRPHVDIENVATGEVWYGPVALERGLVDRLQTSSDYLTHLMEDEGCEVLQLSYSEKGNSITGLLGAAAETAAATAGDAAASLLGSVASRAATGGTSGVDLVKAAAAGAALGSPEAAIAATALRSAGAARERGALW